MLSSTFLAISRNNTGSITEEQIVELSVYMKNSTMISSNKTITYVIGVGEWIYAENRLLEGSSITWLKG